MLLKTFNYSNGGKKELEITYLTRHKSNWIIYEFQVSCLQKRYFWSRKTTSTEILSPKPPSNSYTQPSSILLLLSWRGEWVSHSSSSLYIYMKE